MIHTTRYKMPMLISTQAGGGNGCFTIIDNLCDVTESFNHPGSIVLSLWVVIWEQIQPKANGVLQDIIQMKKLIEILLSLYRFFCNLSKLWYSRITSKC